MGCSCGGAYEWSDTFKALVCIKCGRHSTSTPPPSYEEMGVELFAVRKMLENICECQGNRDEPINKAREFLDGKETQNPHR